MVYFMLCIFHGYYTSSRFESFFCVCEIYFESLQRIKVLMVVNMGKEDNLHDKIIAKSL
jgi:hypothetical protein